MIATSEQVKHKNLLTRRGFLRSGLAAGVAAGVVSLSASCKNSSEDLGESEPLIIESEDAIHALDEFEAKDLSLTQLDSWQLPVGCVLHPAEGTWIPVTQLAEAATPMVKASVFSTASGSLLEVLPRAVSQRSNVEIYDVRCSDSLFAWVELDITTRDWALYASAFEDGELKGEPNLLWEGDADWDPAAFAVSGNALVWQIQPALSGTKTTEFSYCYLWRLGAKTADPVVESQGRFAFAPSVSGGIVTLAPRVLASAGVFYGVSCYTLNDDVDTLVDQLVFPRSVRPMNAVRVGGRIVAAVEASYGTGGVLGSMGTFIYTNGGELIVVDREPLTTAVGHGPNIVVKSRASYLVLNLEDKSYSVLAAADRSVDYGDYPAREGDSQDLISFAIVKDATSGYPSSILVRAFEL